MNGLPSPTSSAAPYARTVAVHSLVWLVAANLVGVWLGITLLWPAVGNLMAPLTWGRWAPVHMGWQLYGWCALPLAGALIAWCFVENDSRARLHARLAMIAWSLSLAAGGVTWLAGQVSGKLFLDWHGWARAVLPLAMVFLWGLLVWHSRRQWPNLTATRRGLRVFVLVLLFFVPGVLFWAAGRGNYHPINPDSGGATGAAVLGSTLGVVTIFMLVPEFLRLERVRGIQRYGAALTASWLIFAVIDKGNVSHHTSVAIAALGTLLVWVPLLPAYARCFAWPAVARPWLIAAAGWWALLVVTGWISFLPGVSEALKFTHALVGHAHLAMAGLVTSVNGAILTVLMRRSAGPWVLGLWQGGCVVYVGAMMLLGWAETDGLAELFRSEPWTQGFLAVRLGGGLAMAAASVHWLWRWTRS
jgi:cytochrome c oxidase cbb3-type subunit I